MGGGALGGGGEGGGEIGACFRSGAEKGWGSCNEAWLDFRYTPEMFLGNHRSEWPLLCTRVGLQIQYFDVHIIHYNITRCARTYADTSHKEEHNLIHRDA